MRSLPIFRAAVRTGIVLAGLASLGALRARATGPFLLNAQQADFRSRPEYIRDHFAHVETLPFDGLVFTTESGAVLMNGAPRSYGEIAADFAPVRGLEFARLKHNLTWINVDRPADFFGDWSATIENFRHFARALREAGVAGILFDNEEYRRRLFNYPDDCSQPERSLGEYQEQARLRGRELMQAMTDEFPGMVCLVVHGPYSSFDATPFAVHRNQTDAETEELRGPFSIGLMEGMDSLSRFVDGGAVYAYRSAEDFQLSYDFRKSTLGSAAADCPYISSELRGVWPLKLHVGFGVYNGAFGGEQMDPTTLRTTLANALARCDEYVWLYFEGENWNAPGEVAAEWKDAVTAARAASSVPPHEPGPSVDLTAPATDSTFVSPAAIQLEATASAIDHPIAKIEFFADGLKVGEALAAPFTVNWIDPAPGAHVLTAKATSNAGATATSAAVPITVGTEFAANINFQPLVITPPRQYFADTGELYGSRENGLTYGWNISHTAHTREGAGSPDLRLDTLAQMRSGATWEMAVPNGSYAVTVAIGDGSFPSLYTIDVEGVSYWTALPLARAVYIQKTNVVAVNDGKLTLDQGNAGEDATRINYIIIAATSAAPAPPGNLTAIAPSAGSVTLHWRDNSSNEIAFVLERSNTADFAAAVHVANVPAEATTYDDSSVAPGQLYHYRLQAVNSNGTSPFTDTAVVKSASPDIDADGIADEFEAAPLVVGIDDRETNSDGDRNSNAAEFFVGTNPLDPSSDLRVTETSLTTVSAARAATVCFPTVPGRSYYLEFNRSLDRGLWTLVAGSESTGDGATHCVMDVPDGVRFYRVRAAAPHFAAP